MSNFRAILGKIGDPSSSYILVVRASSVTKMGCLDFLMNHKKNFPTWGCIIFPDFGNTLITEGYNDGIFRIFSSGKSLSDEDIVDYVKANYKQYDEDDDPVVEETHKVHIPLERPELGPVEYRREVTPLGKVVTLNCCLEGASREYLIKDMKRRILERLAKMDSFWDIRDFPAMFGKDKVSVTINVMEVPEKPREF